MECVETGSPSLLRGEGDSKHSRPSLQSPPIKGGTIGKESPIEGGETKYFHRKV